MHHGLFLKKSSFLHLHTFSDVGWNSDCDDHTLTNAYVVFWGHNAISWSKNQCFVARSSTEAKFRVVALTSSEFRCLKSLLLELGVLVATPMSIYHDNFGTTCAPIQLSFSNEAHYY